MDNIRAIFTKTNRAKFISHLDLFRCMQRAIKRAKLPIMYSQGFNPHSYIMFPLALSLGISSNCEIMDFTLTESVEFSDIKDKLNSVLPDGLKIVTVGFQNKKHTEIAYAQYDIQIANAVSANEMFLKFQDFLSMDKIEIEKMSKKKVLSAIDIKPSINLLNINIEDDKLFISLQLPTGTQNNLNINAVFEAFEKYMKINIDSIRIERTKIMCQDGEIFS